MKENSKKFRMLDGLYLCMIILPIVAAMVIKILTASPPDGSISIAGARILWQPFKDMGLNPIVDLIISEAQVNSWLILITIVGLCLFLTHGIQADKRDWRQLAAEWVVEKLDGLVTESMHPVYHKAYPPFIGAIIALSACSSFMSLFGLFPPTSDVNVIGGWGLLVFILVTKTKLKGGLLNYAGGFLQPVFIMLPMNILSEVMLPVAMSFRHFGNVMSGTVVATLVAWALQNLSNLVLGWLPGFLGTIPFLQIGIPAVLSVYFDLFSSSLQAYIFAMLTMLNISENYPEDVIQERLAKREARKAKKAKAA